MPINSQINADLNTIIRTVTGKLTSTDVKEAISESLLHADFKKSMHVIWDLTAADTSKSSLDQLMDIVEYIRENFNVRGADYKIILVAPTDVNFSISRMFQCCGSELLTSIHVVKDLNEAYRYID